MVDGNKLGDVGFQYLGVSYSKMDCQAFVEQCLRDCGLNKNLAGSNAWFREVYNHGAIMTPEECVQQLGCVPKGAFLFILERDGKEPEKYKADGLGNASHIGICTIPRGEGAIHSSASRGCVAESKFKEKANLKYIKEDYLSKAYYSEDPYGKRHMGLDERFYGNKWASRFARFCRDWEDIRNSNNWGKEYEWFEPKQETCHLSGILLYLFDPVNAERIKGKSIHLYNIYWKLGEKDGTPEMSQKFEDLANSFLTEIIEEYGNKLGITDLETGTYTVNDIRATPELLSPDIHSLGADLDMRLKEYDELVIGQTRKSLNK